MNATELSVLEAVGREPMTAAQLAAHLGLSQAHTRAVLARLRDEGFVWWSHGGLVRERHALVLWARMRAKPAAPAQSAQPRPRRPRPPRIVRIYEPPVLTGYSARDGLGNEVAWFADEHSARELWAHVPDAVTIVDARTGQEVRP